MAEGRTFDFWFHGSPLLTTGVNTNGFRYWFHGSPVLQVITLGPGFGTLQCRARISRSTTCALDMRGRIAKQNSSTLDMRGRILVTGPPTISMKGRINPTVSMRARLSRRQGWPIPDSIDPAFANFQPTQLLMQARIKTPTTGNQTLQAKARIFHGSTQSLEMRCRVVTAQRLSMKAKIQGKKSVHAPFTYIVQSPQLTRMNVIFYTIGVSTLQSLSMQAKIVGRFNRRFTGHFLVTPNAPAVINGVQRLSFSNDVIYAQTLAMRAFIKR